MEYKTNSFGDVLIAYESTKPFPTDVDCLIKHCVVIANAPLDFKHPNLPHLIASTSQYGNVFGNDCAHENFPVIKNDVCQGAGAVLMTRLKGKLYFILEQVKNRPYVMNPAGYSKYSDKDLQQTAQREVFEETELKIKEWQPLAEWCFNMTFAGLKFTGYTKCGMSFVDQLPASWAAAIHSPVTIIPVKNDEVESLIFLDADFLHEVPDLNANKQFPTKLSGHHFNLLLKAAVIANTQEAALMTHAQDTSYLIDFKYF